MSFYILRATGKWMLVLLLAMISACAAYRPLDTAFHAALKEPYRMDAGDGLRITVFGQDDISNTYAVDKAGYLAMPLIGSVPAKGRTAKELEGQIATQLRKGFIRDPDVSVEVSTYRPFFMFGEVGTAGQYSYVPGMTVQNAIAVAGGFTARAEQRDVDVTRTVNGEIITGRVPLTDPLLPGDTVRVRERLF